MPRGRKPKVILSLPEQIEKTKEEIKDIELKLKNKKADLKKLESQISEEQTKQLLDALSSSGKSLEDVLSFLSTVDNKVTENTNITNE